MTDYDVDWYGTINAVLEDLNEIRVKLLLSIVPSEEAGGRLVDPLSECIEKIVVYRRGCFAEFDPAGEE